jgi:hypothetical protein
MLDVTFLAGLPCPVRGGVQAMCHCQSGPSHTAQLTLSQQVRPSATYEPPSALAQLERLDRPVRQHAGDAGGVR